MKSKCALFWTAASAAFMLTPAGQSQPRPIAPHLYLRAAGSLTETTREQLERLESEYQDALARANELSGRLDAMLAEAKARNASIVQRTKPICDQLGGAIDDSGTCVFICPHDEPDVCDTKNRDFNQQAAALIQEKQLTLTKLKAFASLVRAAWTDAATKKQAWEQLNAQLEKH